jgi:hypothetical protein
MDPTRSQEPNHSQLTAEGNACDLHHTSTGQWSLTHNTESDAGPPDGQRQTFETQRVTGTASWIA